jgi:FKBP-type peptidyl-prolyl cis-trans isomerase FkpA
MKKIIFLLAVIIAILNACKQPAKRINPMLNIIQDQDGDTIGVGDFLSVTYSEKTVDGKLISGSYDYDVRPTLMFREQSAFKGDFFDLLGYLSEGDSAQFKINIDSITNKMKRVLPPGIKGKYLIYNVKINKVVSRGKLNDSAYNAAIETYRKIANEQEMKNEPAKLARYISQNHLKLQQTASGLKYLLTKKGNGPLPVKGDTVLVNYTAKTLTGKIFETTSNKIAQEAGIFKNEYPYTPAKIPVQTATGNALSGFMEAASLFPKGSKVMLVIPSKRAYGAANHGMLEPYTPLVCDMEIVDVIYSKRK